MTTTKKPKASAKAQAATAAPKAKTLQIHQQPGKSGDRVMAECALSAVTGNAATALMFSRGTFGDSDITESVAVMREKAERVRTGDLADLETTLTAQAATLNAIFNEMARRAALNMGEYVNTADTYMRLALKAQSQCRTTIEVLAEIKNPRPVAFVKQANISNGHQQVNNGATALPAHGNNSIQSNELSGAGYELLPDTRASAVTGRIDTPVAAMEEVDRATN